MPDREHQNRVRPEPYPLTERVIGSGPPPQRVQDEQGDKGEDEVHERATRRGATPVEEGDVGEREYDRTSPGHEDFDVPDEVQDFVKHGSPEV